MSCRLAKFSLSPRCWEDQSPAEWESFLEELVEALVLVAEQMNCTENNWYPRELFRVALKRTFREEASDPRIITQCGTKSGGPPPKTTGPGNGDNGSKGLTNTIPCVPQESRLPVPISRARAWKKSRGKNQSKATSGHPLKIAPTSNLSSLTEDLDDVHAIESENVSLGSISDDDSMADDESGPIPEQFRRSSDEYVFVASGLYSCGQSLEGLTMNRDQTTETSMFPADMTESFWNQSGLETRLTDTAMAEGDDRDSLVSELLESFLDVDDENVVEEGNTEGSTSSMSSSSSQVGDANMENGGDVDEDIVSEDVASEDVVSEDDVNVVDVVDTEMMDADRNPATGTPVPHQEVRRRSPRVNKPQTEKGIALPLYNEAMGRNAAVKRRVVNNNRNPSAAGTKAGNKKPTTKPEPDNNKSTIKSELIKSEPSITTGAKVAERVKAETAATLDGRSRLQSPGSKHSCKTSPPVVIDLTGADDEEEMEKLKRDLVLAEMNEDLARRGIDLTRRGIKVLEIKEKIIERAGRGGGW